MKIALKVVTSDDCFQCRQCCKLAEEERTLAPLFTDAQRNWVDEKLAPKAFTSERRGTMWRVRLREAAGGGQWVCHLLDHETAAAAFATWGSSTATPGPS